MVKWCVNSSQCYAGLILLRNLIEWWTCIFVHFQIIRFATFSDSTQVTEVCDTCDRHIYIIPKADNHINMFLQIANWAGKMFYFLIYRWELVTISTRMVPQACKFHSWTDSDGSMVINTLRPRQRCRHFSEDIFQCVFLTENVWTSIQISLKFVPNGPIDNIPALVKIMAWRRPGDKPLSEPMLIILLMHICITRPQWLKTNLCNLTNICLISV